MSLDDSDLLDFVEKATAEDRVKGIIEPEAIDFKKLVKEWKTRKKRASEVPAEPIIVWAQLVGDKLELSFKKEIPLASISVHQNEIHVGELRIAIVLSETETAYPAPAR